MAVFDLFSRRGRSGNPAAKPRGIIRLKLGNLCGKSKHRFGRGWWCCEVDPGFYSSGDFESPVEIYRTTAVARLYRLAFY